jgi:hypothetical protein
MTRLEGRLLPLLLIGIGALVAGCGGGGDPPVQGLSPAPSGPTSVLAWNPPTNYADNAVLDPYRDLDHYEVYIRSDSKFTETDLPIATIAAVNDAPGGKVLEKEFILENIQDFIDPGSRHHYVSLKAVGIDGQKSDFMPAVLWERG